MHVRFLVLYTCTLGSYAHTNSINTILHVCKIVHDEETGIYQITHASIKPRQDFLYLKYSLFSFSYKMKKSINILPDCNRPIETNERLTVIWVYRSKARGNIHLK